MRIIVREFDGHNNESTRLWCCWRCHSYEIEQIEIPEEDPRYFRYKKLNHVFLRCKRCSKELYYLGDQILQRWQREL